MIDVYPLDNSSKSNSHPLQNKLWIQHDGTEEGIAVDLVAAGISKEQVVLGFRTVEERKHSEFAVS